MSTSSSSSNRPPSRRSVHGVPTKCWCGKGIVIWASETKDNPFRRFYRCEVALQRKSECHLFKWEDEAILDEVRMLDAKVMDLVHDFHSLSKTVIEQLDSHKTSLLQLEGELRSVMANSLDEATRQMKEDIDAVLSSNMATTHLCDNGGSYNFAAAVAIVGAIAFIYWKLF